MHEHRPLVASVAADDVEVRKVLGTNHDLRATTTWGREPLLKINQRPPLSAQLGIPPAQTTGDAVLNIGAPSRHREPGTRSMKALPVHDAPAEAVRRTPQRTGPWTEFPALPSPSPVRRMANPARRRVEVGTTVAEAVTTLATGAVNCDNVP